MHPCAPYFACNVSGGPTATLLQWPVACKYMLEGDTNRATASTDDETVSTDTCVDIDGSMLEGGGQVLRVALGCSALLRTAIHIRTIRGCRPNPGLGHQHATGVKLVAEGCGAVVDPPALLYGAHCEGAPELYMWPGIRGIRGGKFIADTHTAGAVTLLLQASLPCFLLGQCENPCTLELRGGTNVRGAPSIDYTGMALVPLLQRMGVPADGIILETRQRGFYPRGGGIVDVTVNPVARLEAINLQERGFVASITGVVTGTHK